MSNDLSINLQVLQCAAHLNMKYIFYGFYDVILACFVTLQDA